MQAITPNSKTSAKANATAKGMRLTWAGDGREEDEC